MSAFVTKVNRVGLLLLGVGWSGTFVAGAETGGTFTRTGDMTTPRLGHTATLLANGKVLITGGNAGSSRPAGAELFDPGTGTFSATGDLTTIRSGNSATLLRDGRVLIAGGDSPGDAAAVGTAELYDPSTETFTRTGSMLSPQRWHRAILLNNGKVLIAGGGVMCPNGNDGCAIVDRPEIYDPATGRFAATGDYADKSGDSYFGVNGLIAAPLTLLPNGDVLLATQPTAKIYDPASGTFRLTGQMTRGVRQGFRPRAGIGGVASLLPNGRVLLAGGENFEDAPFADAELYDPVAGTFSATGSMNRPKGALAAARLSDGTVLVTGSGDDDIVGFAELYDLAAGRFVMTGQMTSSRSHHTATSLRDGRVLIAGGALNARFRSPISRNAELYTPASLAPAIIRQPSSQTISRGRTVAFSAAAVGMPAPTYQWLHDGAILPGETNATLVIAHADFVSAGAYRVVATSSAESATSDIATLDVLAPAGDSGRLGNLSILAPLASGETLTLGLVIGGAGTNGAMPLLVRAAGPSLAQFGVTGFLPTPALSLVDTGSRPGVVVATNAGWGGTAALVNAFAHVGAFPYSSPTSRDSAIFRGGGAALAAGSYAVQVSGAGGAGLVIAELYDATPTDPFASPTPRLINVSALQQIDAGAALTAGFAVAGPTARTVLIRAIGPTLARAPFHLPGGLPAPALTLVEATTRAILATNRGWDGDPALSLAADHVGAFAVTNPGSNDAMLLRTLAPGTYTAEVSSGGKEPGVALLEIYEVP